MGYSKEDLIAFHKKNRDKIAQYEIVLGEMTHLTNKQSEFIYLDSDQMSYFEDQVRGLEKTFKKMKSNLNRKLGELI